MPLLASPIHVHVPLPIPVSCVLFSLLGGKEEDVSCLFRRGSDRGKGTHEARERPGVGVAVMMPIPFFTPCVIFHPMERR